MDTKYCENCNTDKDVSDFSTRTRKSGYIYTFKNCKECEKKRKKEPEYIKKSLLRHKKYYLENKELILENVKKYRQNNIENVKEYQKQYHKNDSLKRNRRRFHRRQTNPEYRIMCNLSSRINIVLKSKSIRTNKLIGCTPQEFKNWIEYQFNSNMNWDNYGSYWQIDHVTPCNSFDLTIIQEQYDCFIWENCQPLEKIRNITKSDKIIPFEILLHELKVNYYKKSIMQHIQIAGNS
jgi:hypothetical protein